MKSLYSGLLRGSERIIVFYETPFPRYSHTMKQGKFCFINLQKFCVWHIYLRRCLVLRKSSLFSRTCFRFWFREISEPPTGGLRNLITPHLRLIVIGILRLGKNSLHPPPSPPQPPLYLVRIFPAFHLLRIIKSSPPSGPPKVTLAKTKQELVII